LFGRFKIFDKLKLKFCVKNPVLNFREKLDLKLSKNPYPSSGGRDPESWSALNGLAIKYH
jgi:hypothetical protein